tara:strand:- start:362 stop:691 length:330 start_codon:yes stop_codon:yes gene_type:complete
MSKDLLLSYDEITGKTTYLTEDVDGLKTVTKVNVDPVLEYAKYQESEWRPNSLIGDTQKHQQKIADIPNVLFAELQRKFGDIRYNRKKWLQWLQDPENKHFRTTGGRLI